MSVAGSVQAAHAAKQVVPFHDQERCATIFRHRVRLAHQGIDICNWLNALQRRILLGLLRPFHRKSGLPNMAIPVSKSVPSGFDRNDATGTRMSAERFFVPGIGVGKIVTILRSFAEPSTPQRTLVTSLDNLHSAILAMSSAAALCMAMSSSLERLV